MRRISIFGSNSTISKTLVELASDKYECKVYGRNNEDISFDAMNIDSEYITDKLDFESDVYFFSLGYLLPRNIVDQNQDEITRSMNVNLIFIVKACEIILNKNKKARIIIIGSESGKKGSFDTTYFLSKSALSKYVRERKIEHPNQQILMISPSTIIDSNMTMKRDDQDRVESVAMNHPKKRLIYTRELTEFIFMVIDGNFDYLTNTEIEFNGGKFARM